MDLGEILRVMRKRWYLMAPIMVLTVALTALAYFLLPTKYESTSTVSLLTAERASIISKSGNTNPYLTFDTSLVATADFLSRSLSSKGAQEDLKKLGVGQEYTVALADNAQGPFITITVDGNNESQVLHSTTVLTDYAGQKLEEIQKASGVKPEDMIRLTTIVPPQTPDALIKNKLQVVIAIAGAGTAAAFMLTFVTEGLARSRHAAGSAGRPALASVRSTVSGPPPVPAQQNGSAVESDRTVVIKVPPKSRTPAPHLEETQLIIGSTDRVGAKTPVGNRLGDGPMSSAAVYRSNATNGKSQDDVERSREGDDSRGKRRTGA
ncbi:hypothetical protein ODJ79_22005 [Actinoplanes sp. KI2]|uniref:hypothetical protein n=1 Tax=Actinoplanes sp. KI2 TaxID=2983315 RepID=UPI0021D5E427|nr:hypothetical protein [Actinoplanes sp. KI2]MCU7726413.1 hypothetical protein [Actinoplanes sp. KI2]